MKERKKNREDNFVGRPAGRSKAIIVCARLKGLLSLPLGILLFFFFYSLPRQAQELCSLLGMLAGLRLLPKDCGVRSIFPPSGSDLSRLSEQRALQRVLPAPSLILGSSFCTEGAGRAAPRPLRRSPPFLLLQVWFCSSRGGLRDDLPTPWWQVLDLKPPLSSWVGFFKRGELEGEKKGT